MIHIIIAALWNVLQEMMRKALLGLSALMLVATSLHRSGILRRFIHRFAEYEMSRELNGVRVTIGYLDVDLRSGHVVLRDLIVHSPFRDDWQWDSPLLARVASIEASINIVSFLDTSTILPIAAYLGYPCREVYSVCANGIQIFVEKRHNVFNFHLVDISLDIPDPAIVMPKCHHVTSLVEEQEKGIETIVPEANNDTNKEPSLALTSAQFTNKKDSNSNTHSKSSSSITDPSAEMKANEIVTSMLGAVSSLGRAVNEGGKEGFEKALGLQKEGVLNSLKQFQQRRNTSSFEQSNDGNGSVDASLCLENSSSNMLSSSSLQNTDNTSNDITTVQNLAMEGMKVMKQMGKAMNKNVTEIQEQIDSYKKPPPKKKGWVKKPSKDIFRIGSIVLTNVHIFTKNLVMSSSSSATAATTTDITTTAAPVSPTKRFNNSAKRKNSSDKYTDGNDSKATGSSIPPRPTHDNTLGLNKVTLPQNNLPPNASGWSPPILLKTVTMTSVDLCPPHSQLSIGLKIEAIQNIVVQKLLAELAKNSSGKVLQMALGDVFAWMEFKGSSGGRPIPK